MADTISDKLVRLNEVKQQIKQSIIDKGVSVADTDTFASYATKIGEIQTGGGGEVVNKTKFGATVDTFLGDVDADGAMGRPTWSSPLVFSGVKAIGMYGLQYAFYKNNGVTSVDLSSLQTVSDYGLAQAFRDCTGLTSVNLSSLQTVSTYGLQHAFYGCTGITSVDMSSLQEIGASGMQCAFYRCNKLQTISFPSLTSVQTNSFGSSSSNNAFYNCTAMTEIHFRADMQAAIEATNGYANKWGATNATIYFDL